MPIFLWVVESNRRNRKAIVFEGLDDRHSTAFSSPVRREGHVLTASMTRGTFFLCQIAVMVYEKTDELGKGISP